MAHLPTCDNVPEGLMVISVWGGCVTDHSNDVTQVLDMAQGSVDEVAQ